MQRLIGEPMPDVLYRRCVGSLRDHVEPLKKMIRMHRVGFLVVDSVALAAGIEPETADAANGFFDALAVLGVGAVCVAHVTKSAIEQDKPFGSIFWHNGARSTWLVKKTQEHSSNVFSVGLFNKKNNNGPLHAPLGYDVEFGDQRTIFRRRDVHDLPDLAVSEPLKFRIAHALKSRKTMTYAELADELGVLQNSVRQTVKREVGRRFFVLPGDGREVQIGLLQR